MLFVIHDSGLQLLFVTGLRNIHFVFELLSFLMESKSDTSVASTNGPILPEWPLGDQGDLDTLMRAFQHQEG